MFLFFAIAISFFASALKLMIFSDVGFADSDYFWHCTLGKYILESRSIPTQDIFSWISIEKGYVETAHSWLGSIITYLFSLISAESYVGAALFIFVTNFILSLYLALTYSHVSDENEFFNCAHACIAAMVPLMFATVARPLNFGLICFAVAMTELFELYNNPDSKKWYVLPIVSTLWANLHGGSLPILLAFNGLFIVMSLLPKFEFLHFAELVGFSKQRTLKLTGVFFANTVAGLINPYGYKLYIYFFVTNDAATKKYINEWGNAALSLPPVFLALIVVALILLCADKEKPVNIAYFLPVCATLVMTAIHARIYVYLLITTVIFIHEYHQRNSIVINRELSPYFVRNLAIIFSVLGVGLAGLFVYIAPTSFNEITAWKAISPEMYEAIDELAPDKMYNDYNTGGELIHAGYKSFVDSRADPFPGDLLEDAILFSNGKMNSFADMQEFIKEYQFDAILIRSDSSTRIILDLLPEWTEYYSDEALTLFAPSTLFTDENISAVNDNPLRDIWGKEFMDGSKSIWETDLPRFSKFLNRTSEAASLEEESIEQIENVAN